MIFVSSNNYINFISIFCIFLYIYIYIYIYIYVFIYALVFENVRFVVYHMVNKIDIRKINVSKGVIYYLID